MYKAEKEIFSQYDALQSTYQYMLGKQNEILALFRSASFKSVTFIGCGSGLSLCKSAALSTKLGLGIETNAIASGDLMLNFEFYGDILKDSLLVVPSRSGSTSEVLLAVQSVREKLGSKCICVCAVENSKLSGMSDLSLELSWAFDESICQTRTVTNLYTANLMLSAIIAQKQELIKEIGEAIDRGPSFMKEITSSMARVAFRAWDKAVVLADAELEGIAEEGALAFKEICQRDSNYYHILDVRHGPIVLIDEKTLVIVALTPYRRNFQNELILELLAKGATVVTVGSGYENIPENVTHVNLPVYKNYAVCGIPFILAPQLITLNKALKEGINPDEPNGLSAWIEL